jgi:protease-4
MFSLLIKVGQSSSEFSKYDVSKPHTALIEITGEIDQGAFYGSATNVIESLKKAFARKNVKGVILDLNSPGGSPVQSDLIYSEIKRLQAEDKDGRKIYAVVADVCASGCYYIASAANEIYANELSTVGSIGVVASRFGFVELIKKIGVEQRIQTAGKFKAFLDPFSEESSESRAFVQNHIDIIHKIFIDKVRAGRKGKLKEDPLMFSGLFWTGKESYAMGLIDGFKTKNQVARDLIKAEHIIDYTSKQTLSDIVSTNMSGVMSKQIIKEALTGIKYN